MCLKLKSSYRKKICLETNSLCWDLNAGFGSHQEQCTRYFTTGPIGKGLSAHEQPAQLRSLPCPTTFGPFAEVTVSRQYRNHTDWTEVQQIKVPDKPYFSTRKGIRSFINWEEVYVPAVQLPFFNTVNILLLVKDWEVFITKIILLSKF